jgi:collagen type III alpha
MASSGNHGDAGHSSVLEDSHAPGSHAVGGEGYVDFDEYIEIQLRKAGTTIKSTDVLTAVVGAGTLLTAYLLGFIVLDQWLIPGGFGSTARVLLLSALLVAVVAWIGWKVVWPWRRRVNGLYSATTIEKASPGFKGSLVNLVDLLRTEREIPPEVYRSLERRAAVALTHVDVRETVDRRSLLRLSMALFAVVVLFCGYWILSPKNPASSLWRAIAPASEASVATRTKIDSVRPGDVDVVARSQVDVTAEVRGQLPPQAALYYTTADHKFVDERIDARPSAEGSREFHFVINGDNGAGILQDMTYRIVAGDDTTKDYKIHVIQPPSATIDSIRLDYPEYTRLEPSTQTTGAIDALEGTRVTLRATSNMPLRSASLQFFDDESASKRAEEVPVHVENGNKLQAEWTLQMRSDGSYPHFYRIFCTSVGGEFERTPSLYTLEIRADRPPEIVLVDPKTDLELPANAELPLLFEARDPDFTLSFINLKVEKDGAAVSPEEIYDGHDQQVRKTYKWSLAKYHLRPKDTITYWLEAQDNRKPLANTKETSPRLRIHITDPVPESQVKKNFDMAEQRQKEEAKRTEDQNAQQKPDDEQVDDASKPRQDRPKPQPKDKQNAAHSQQQDKPAEQMQQEREQKKGDDPKSKDEQGSGGEGDSKDGSGQKGTGDQGKTGDQGGGDKGQSEKLNPDDAKDDPKVFDKLNDAMQKEGEQGGDGSKSKPDGEKGSKQGAENKKDENKSNQAGSESKPNAQSAKENRDKQPGAKPQPGSPSEPKDGKNQTGQNQDPQKSESKNPDGKDSDGGKPDSKNSDNKSPDNKSANPNDAGSKPEPNQSREPQGQNSAGKDNKNSQGSPKPDAGQPENGNPKGDKKPDKSQGDQPAGDQSKGEKLPGANKPSGENPSGEKKPGEKSGDQKAGDQKPGDKQAGDEKSDKQPGEKQSGDKSGNDKQDAGDKAGGQKQDGNQKPDGGQKQAGDNSQSPQRESRGKDEKGQSSSGDQSAADKKNSSRSSESKSQPDQGQSSKPDAADQSQGANSKDPKGERNQNDNPQDAAQRNQGKDEDGKKDANPGQSGEKSPRGDKSPDRKDATKKTDATSRDGDRSQQPQREAGEKPRSGQRENDPPNLKSRDVPPEKPDEKANKGKPSKPIDPEEAPKGVDQKTDKQRAKSIRDEQQPNDRGDEQSDVGKTGEPKRTFDKDSKLSQEGTDKAGAKEKASQEDRASKSGKDQSSPEGAPKPGEKPPEGQPQQAKAGQDGQPAKQGDKGQPAQNAEQSKEGKDGKDGQAQSGEGKPGKPGQGPPSGKQGGGKEPSKSKGQSGAAGMGSGKGTDNGGGGFNNGNGSGAGDGLTNTEKDANLDYARKATDLILNRLQGQLSRGQVDEKVLKELGWTKDEVRRFVDRMRRQAQSEGGNTPADEARRLQFQETLRSLDFKHPSKSRSGAGLKKAGVLEMENRRSTPPAEYSEQYRAYTKSLSNSQTPRDKK